MDGLPGYFSPATYRRSHVARATASVLAATLALPTTGCVAHHVRAVPISQLSLEKEHIESRKLRISTSSGLVILHVRGFAFPYVEGTAEPGKGIVQLDLRTVRKATEVLWDTKSGKDVTTRVLPEPLAESIKGGAQTALVSRDVEFQTSQGRVRLEVVKVEPPIVWGRPAGGSGWVRVDLREATWVEIVDVDPGMSVLASLGVAAGVMAALFVIVALTKESCPFVYVDRGAGPELVGEAYAGAVFRSLERDDLLPLPALPEGRVTVRLRNEARETQFTDRAELLLVEHAPGARAVSTYDGGLLLVDGGAPPASTRNLEGRETTGRVVATDGVLWEADAFAAAALEAAPLTEGLIADFDRPPEQAVLEIVGGNTPWLDVVFGRFLAALGDRFGRYNARWNEPRAATRLRAFKEREGIDLAVDVDSGRGWRRIASVPTVGPIALRRVAVPIPDARAGDGTLRVRLTGGLGFWRVDALSVSREVEDAPHTLRVPSASASGDDSGGALERLARADGRYHVLREVGERLDLTFDVPPARPGVERDAFLLTTGYYNVLQPIQGRWSPGTLRAAGRTPAGMSRFSLELARAYLAAAREAGPPASGDGGEP